MIVVINISAQTYLSPLKLLELPEGRYMRFYIFLIFFIYPLVVTSKCVESIWNTFIFLKNTTKISSKY